MLGVVARGVCVCMHVVLCYAMLCYVMLCYAILWYTTCACEGAMLQSAKRQGRRNTVAAEHCEWAKLGGSPLADVEA